MASSTTKEDAAPAALDVRISLQKLEVLCLVVELGGVTKAAERLFVAQPVVTAHLRSLEQRLHVKLFERNGRHLELTEAGERVHAWAAESLARARTMYREVQELSDGDLGAVFLVASMSVGSYVLPSILTRFRKSRPRASISLAIREQEAVWRSVEQGECDFGIVVADQPLEIPTLVNEILTSEEVLLVAAPDGPPAGETISLSELCDVPVLGPPHGSVRHKLVDHALDELGAPGYQSVLELGHPEAMKRAAREGLGAALLFRSAVEEEIERGVLRHVRFSDVTPMVPIFAVTRADKRLSPLQTALLQEIRDSLASR
jgi:DNA-binding transcriptional LysR family regulator